MTPWIRLAIGAGATMLVGMGIGRFSYTPMMPALIEGGGLGAAEAGAVAAFNLAGYLVGALAAPTLARRWGEAAALKLCLAVALVCLTASIAPWGFAWLAFWRFTVGAAVGVMMIYSLALVTRAAPPGKLGAATGIVFTGVGLGILLSGTLVPVLLRGGLAMAWSGLAVLAFVAVAVAFWGLGAADGARPSPPGGAARPRPRFSFAVLRLIAGQTMFTMGLIPHTIYWVDYLVRGLGHDIAVGGLHWALFGLGAVSGTYLWGRLADRAGFRVGLVLVFATLAAGVALPVLETAAWALVASSLVVGAQPGFSAIMAGRTHQLMGADHMAAVWRWMALTAGVFQAVGGYVFVGLFDYSGSYTPVFLAGAAAMALGAAISLDFRPAKASPDAT